ncbi:MAG: T9SS type A sorting domain-containing protein [Flavobacteriales bacterium]
MFRSTFALWLCIVGIGLTSSHSQCPTCQVDINCSSDNGFPTICPESLPSATVAEPYLETITFYLPAEVVDPGSGVTAALNSVTITSITGVPIGLSVELDDADGIYYPASGQTSGCANVCGTPLIDGTFEMVISISAVASAFGIEQVVTDSFPYLLVVNAGEGGSSTFSFTPSTGCGALLADFQASLSGNPNQITNYNWDFGNGQSGSDALVNEVNYEDPGVFNVTLETTISDQLLTQVTLNSTAGGGWDDGWSPAPDPYFVLSDAAGGNVFVSSVADETYSATWNGLNVVLANPPYTITFYDEDLFPDDDYLGSMSFTPNGSGTLDLNADPSYGQLTIGLQTALNTIDTAEVIVSPLPVIDIAWNSTMDTLVCSGESLIQYDWYWGDSLQFSGSDSTFAPLINGWYHAIGTDSNGCSGVSDSLLFCAPDASFALNLSLGELPEMVVADGNFEAFVWTFNGQSSDTIPDGYWPTDFSGWYSAMAWDTYGCPWSSDSVLVCWPLNQPIISETAEGLLSVTPEFPFYQWWFNGEPIPGATDATFENTGPGLYAVSVTDFEDCNGVISEDWVVVGIPIEGDSKATPSWLVYPNPASEALTVSFAESNGAFEVQALDVHGRVIEQIQLVDGMQWNISTWPSGVYFVSARSIGSNTTLPSLRVIKK